LSYTPAVAHLGYLSVEEFFHPKRFLRKTSRGRTDLDKETMKLYHKVTGTKTGDYTAFNLTSAQCATLKAEMKADKRKQLNNRAKNLRSILGVGCEDLRLAVGLFDCNAIGFHYFRFTAVCSPSFKHQSVCDGETSRSDDNMMAYLHTPKIPVQLAEDEREQSNVGDTNDTKSTNDSLDLQWNKIDDSEHVEKGTSREKKRKFQDEQKNKPAKKKRKKQQSVKKDRRKTKERKSKEFVQDQNRKMVERQLKGGTANTTNNTTNTTEGPTEVLMNMEVDDLGTPNTSMSDNRSPMKALQPSEDALELATPTKKRRRKSGAEGQPKKKHKEKVKPECAVFDDMISEIIGEDTLEGQKAVLERFWDSFNDEDMARNKANKFATMLGVSLGKLVIKEKIISKLLGDVKRLYSC